MVYKPFSVVAVVAAFAIAVLPAHAAAPSPASPAGKPLGIVPVHQQAKAGGVGNLLYHSGGSVQTGTHHTYAIYWGASSTFPDSNYQTLINRFFQDVAAASGQTSNVYDSDTQYYQTINSVTTNITYSESFSGSWADATNPTSSGCTSTAGGSVACVSDAQIEQEVTKAIQANNWPEGSGNEYFVFLGNGISTCSGSSCFVSNFCAYHSHYTDSSTGSTVLYANMPYTGYSLAACGSGQYPNGDSAADSTINVTSHEANETITDELGNAWFDRTGYENGDKCAWKFGTSLGNNGSGSYNQVINGHDYYMQGEWSNHSSTCVWSGT
jgi:hypothetical protein